MHVGRKLDVEFAVPLSADVVELGLPESNICELVLVLVEPDMLLAINEAKAKIVVDPSVVVNVVDPLVIVETMADVVTAEELLLVLEVIVTVVETEI